MNAQPHPLVAKLQLSVQTFLNLILGFLAVWLWWRPPASAPSVAEPKITTDPPPRPKLMLPRMPQAGEAAVQTVTKQTPPAVVKRMTPPASNVPRSMSTRKAVSIPSNGAAIPSHRRCTSSSGTTSTGISVFQTPAKADRAGTLNARESLAVALRCAIVRHEVRSIQALLENKSDLVASLLTNWSDPFGHAIIHTAVATVEPAIVDTILGFVPSADRKVVVNFPGPQGRTALHMACTKRSLAICQTLLENGADPNALTHAATSPLHLAASYNDYDLCNALLEHGANPNCVSQFDAIPLLTAVRLKNSALVRLLLQHGANPRLSAKEGTTAKCLAWRTGETEIYAMIEGQIEKFGHQREASKSSLTS